MWSLLFEGIWRVLKNKELWCDKELMPEQRCVKKKYGTDYKYSAKGEREERESKREARFSHYYHASEAHPKKCQVLDFVYNWVECTSMKVEQMFLIQKYIYFLLLTFWRIYTTFKFQNFSNNFFNS